MIADYSLRTMLEKFKQAMAVKNYSPRTIEIRHNDIMRFIKWCDERALEDVRVINKAEIERYQRWLSAYRRSTDGHRLNIESQLRFISSLRMFFQWLSRKEFILRNPTEDVELPRKGKRIPKAILTRQEVEIILKQPDLSTDRGIRDRAILETLYSTGIRREELINLKLEDLDIERGMLAIRAGKGAKDRVIPIGERAILWIEKYLLEVRSRMANTGESALFINHRGQALGTMGLAWLSREYIKQANIGKRGACHIFRHTCATLMLEGGADIRYIQQMLGHEDLSTTQLYTRVYDRKLKEVHNQSHPGAQLKHKPNQTEEPEE